MVPSDGNDGKLLLGQRLAIAGRLTSLSGGQMQSLIARLGGSWAARADAETTLVVVGEGCWPLTRRGRMSPNLRRAFRLRRQGVPLEIERESEFLRRICGVDSHDAPRRFTLLELARLLAIPRRKIECWIDRGLIRPAETRLGMALFDYQDVASLRHLARLLDAGVTTQRLAASLRQLRRWNPRASHGLVQLSLLAGSGRVVARLPDGRLVEPSGQLLLLQDESADEQSVPYQAVRSLDEELEEALALEMSERYSEAAALYRRLLDDWGDEAQLWLNYGNALYALGEVAGATEAFSQATACNRQFVAAWNNLGAACFDLGQLDRAEAALRQALALDSTYANAHHNLADLLSTCGRCDEAAPHWAAAGSPPPQSLRSVNESDSTLD